jgi:type II secretory pathway pseudopilin PulG
MNEHPPASSLGERGFTFIEGLVATAILLVVAIGILPLFANSISNNSRGSDSTTASNFGKTALENLAQMPFNGTDLLIASGSTQKVLSEWWKPGTGPINDPTQGWQSTSPTSSTFTTWTRSTTVEEFGVRDVLNNGALVTPLDGSTQANFVQLKRITVNVQSSKINTVTALGAGHQGAVLGGGENIVLQMVKAF